MLLGIFYLKELDKSDGISLSNNINSNVWEVIGGSHIKKKIRRQIYEDWWQNHYWIGWIVPFTCVSRKKISGSMVDLEIKENISNWLVQDVLKLVLSVLNPRRWSGIAWKLIG